MLQKLDLYGLDYHTHEWFKSYLTNRKQRVTIGRNVSSMMPINEVIPQSSTQGPVLFLIFINDLPLYVDSDIDLFADDTTLIPSSDLNNIQDQNEKLSSSATQVDNWVNANNLPLNHAKSKVMLISGKRLKVKLSEEDRRLIVTVNGSSFEQTDHTKLLGLKLDDELNFECHIDAICKKISKCICIFKNFRNYLPQSELNLFYNSMIKPLFLYGSVILTSSSRGNLTALLKLQKREARVILDANLYHPSVPLFNKLRWLPFYNESDMKKVVMHINVRRVIHQHICQNNSF